MDQMSFEHRLYDPQNAAVFCCNFARVWSSLLSVGGYAFKYVPDKYHLKKETRDEIKKAGY